MIDPTRRETFCCADCSTTNMVATNLPGYREDGSDGALVVVVHDDSCPWFAALPETDRCQPDDYGVVQHLAQSETSDGDDAAPARPGGGE